MRRSSAAESNTNPNTGITNGKTGLKQALSFSSSSSSSSSSSPSKLGQQSVSLQIPIANNPSKDQMLAAPSHNPFQTPLQIRYYGSESVENPQSNAIANANATANIVVPTSNIQYSSTKKQPPRSLRSSSAPLPLYADQQVSNQDDRAVYERLASEKHHGGMYTAREMVLPPDTSFIRKRVSALGEIPGSVARQEIVPGHKFGLPATFKEHGTDESIFYREQPKVRNQQLITLAAKSQLASLKEKHNMREYMPPSSTRIPSNYSPNTGRFAYTTRNQNNVLQRQESAQA